MLRTIGISLLLMLSFNAFSQGNGGYTPGQEKGREQSAKQFAPGQEKDAGQAAKSYAPDKEDKHQPIPNKKGKGNKEGKSRK